MIDIMLVLLIIFMIVTPLIANGFKATMPQGTNLEKRPEGDGEVVLGIDAAGGYFVNGVAIPAAALEDQLKSIFSQRPEDKVLYFRADKDLPFSKIQDAVETARKAGVAVMAAITEVKPSGKGLFDLPKEK
jgi:biopolymer transport protein TolR